MANYQNNMRCGRAGNVYQQRPSYRRGAPGSMNRPTVNSAEQQRRMASGEGCGCENDARKQQGMRSGEGCGCRNEERQQRRMESEEGCSCHKEERQQRGKMPECMERERRSEMNESDEVRSCRCREDELAGMPLAMAYVPWQTWCDIYASREGFSRGTVFAQLDKPFYGRGGCNR